RAGFEQDRGFGGGGHPAIVAGARADVHAPACPSPTGSAPTKRKPSTLANLIRRSDVSVCLVGADPVGDSCEAEPHPRSNACLGSGGSVASSVRTAASRSTDD